jgi:restriction system protein
MLLSRSVPEATAWVIELWNIERELIEMATKHDLPAWEMYFPPLVLSLKARGGSATIEELEEDVSEALKLSDEILAVPHGDGPRSQFQYELAWVRTYLKKVGALENSERGVWRLTPIGAAMSERELRDVPRRVRADTRKARLAYKAEDTAEADIESDSESAREIDWKEQLLDALLAMKPEGIERHCQRLLRESGFTKVEVTGRSGDGGIDGIGVLRVRLVSFHVLFQSKRWKGSVGAGVIRDFRGAMVGRADKGLIITTGTFTADARREATRDGAPAIDLVDGEALADLLKQLSLGVRVNMVEDVQVIPDFFNSI